MSAATLLRGFEVHVLEVGGCRLRAFAGGDGPPLVLVHGLGGAATNWSELAPLLARRYRVLVPDLPGHGCSQPATAPDGLASLADLVLALAEQVGMVPAAVAGHSLGADVAVRMAARRPEAISALVLLAAGGIAAKRRRARLFLGAAAALRPSRLAARHRLTVARRPRLRRVVFGWWGAADPARLTPSAVLGFLDGAAHARDTVTASRALLEDEPRTVLADVGCPALVVWGARDRLTPLEDGFEYARLLDAPLRTLAGTGHLLIGERPAECAAVLEPFLGQTGLARSTYSHSSSNSSASRAASA